MAGNLEASENPTFLPAVFELLSNLDSKRYSWSISNNTGKINIEISDKHQSSSDNNAGTNPTNSTNPDSHYRSQGRSHTDHKAENLVSKSRPKRKSPSVKRRDRKRQQEFQSRSGTSGTKPVPLEGRTSQTSDTHYQQPTSLVSLACGAAQPFLSRASKLAEEASKERAELLLKQSYIATQRNIYQESTRELHQCLDRAKRVHSEQKDQIDKLSAQSNFYQEQRDRLQHYLNKAKSVCHSGTTRTKWTFGTFNPPNFILFKNTFYIAQNCFYLCI